MSKSPSSRTSADNEEEEEGVRDVEGGDDPGENEEEEEELVLSSRRVTRGSQRPVPTARQKQRTALEALRNARSEGKIHRQRVADQTEDLYVEMPEEEYQERKVRQREFVERDGSGYCDESDEEEGEESDDDFSYRNKRDSTKRRGAHSAKRSGEESAKRARISGPTIESMFRVAAAKSGVQSEQLITLDNDDYLKECLAGLGGTSVESRLGKSSTPCSVELSPSASASSSIRLQPIATGLRRSEPQMHQPPSREARTAEIEVMGLSDAEEETFVDVIAASPPSPSCQGGEQAPGMRTREIHPSSQAGISTAKAAECVAAKIVHSPPVECVPVRTTTMRGPKKAAEQGGKRSDRPQPDSTAMGEAMEVDEERMPSGDVVQFYWLDAFEDPFKHPGTVYLFGRVPASSRISPADPMTKTCCVVVRNVRRQLYFIKREWNHRDATEVSLRDVQLEVEHRLRAEFQITKVKCWPADPQLRCLIRGVKQRFDKKDDLLEVRMEAKAGKCPPVDWEGNTFERVLNTTTTAMERLLTESGIKGPCWLDIKNAVRATQPLSCCQEEFVVDMDQVEEMKSLIAPGTDKPPPAASLVAMNILTAVNEKDKERQVVMISTLYNESFPLDKSQLDERKMKRFCLLTKLQNGVSLPFNLDDLLKGRRLNEVVKRLPDERSLLSCFLAKLTQINPDLLVAHDLTADLQLLRERLLKYNLASWHQLGRLKRTVPLKSLFYSRRSAQWELTAGRLCLDSKMAAAELVHAKSYELDELVEQILMPIDSRVKRVNLTVEQIASPFNSQSSKISLIDLMEWNWTEVMFTLRIVHQLSAVPLFLHITQIVGGVLSRTMMGGRADRNDYLLLHACYRNKYIAPDKHTRASHLKGPKVGKKKQTDEDEGVDHEAEAHAEEDGEEEALPTGTKAAATKKKAGGPQYSGGLVLEPKRGFYQTCIVLLDFNSLYPSIIQEYNICFTTVASAFVDVDESDLPPMPESGKPDGILKREIRELVNRRREEKRLMQREKPGSEGYKRYHIRQTGLKLTANSMYGCLGFESSRFYAKTLAAMITAKGREILVHTKQLVEAEGHAVIYGDTDSLMIDTNEDDVAKAKATGMKLKQTVNKNYRQLELDIDGIYKRLLLLKKKKYAALAVVDLNSNKGEQLKKEMKGLDIVRRDWSELAKEIGEEALELILRSVDRDRLAASVLDRLRDFRTSLNAGEIPVEKFEILKQLHKNPEDDTKNAKAQPHIQVALRLNATQRFRFRAGDIVPYVICKDGTTSSHTQRGYHVSELVAEPDRLSLDAEYYLINQVLPVVSRLCEPIEELAQGRIADALGLDSKRYGGGGGKKTGGHQRAQQAGAANEQAGDGEQFGLEQNFSACEGFQLQCAQCSHVSTLRGPVEGESSSLVCVLEKCAGCSTSLHPQIGFVLKQLILAIKEKVRANLHSPYKCEDVACEASVQLPHPNQFTNEGVVCHQCGSAVMHKVYSDRMLFDQLHFFKRVFDLEAAMRGNNEMGKKSLERRPNAQQTVEDMGRCLAVVDRFLKQNDFNRVDLACVFAPLFVAKRKQQVAAEESSFVHA